MDLAFLLVGEIEGFSCLPGVEISPDSREFRVEASALILRCLRFLNGWKLVDVDGSNEFLIIENLIPGGGIGRGQQAL